MVQTQQLADQEIKRFGVYEISDEIVADYYNIISLKDDVTAQIGLKLYPLSIGSRGNMIHTEHYFSNLPYLNIIIYHIKDVTVIIKTTDRLVSPEINVRASDLSFYHKNPTKRQETRKFLEEILS